MHGSSIQNNVLNAQSTSFNFDYFLNVYSRKGTVQQKPSIFMKLKKTEFSEVIIVISLLRCLTIGMNCGVDDLNCNARYN